MMRMRGRTTERRRERPSWLILATVAAVAFSFSSPFSFPRLVEGYTSLGPTTGIVRGWRNNNARRRCRPCNDAGEHLRPIGFRWQWQLSSSPEQEYSTTDPLPPRLHMRVPNDRSQERRNSNINKMTTNEGDDDRYPDGSPKLPSSFEEHRLLYDWDVSLSSFNVDLHSMAMEDPFQAHDAVEVMRKLYAKSPDAGTTVQPDATSYTTVMDGYIHSGKLQQAQAVFNHMEEMSSENKHERRAIGNDATNDSLAVSSFAPTDLTYLLMAQAWANDYKDDFAGTSAENAMAILRRMQAVAATHPVQPTRTRSGAGGPSDPTTSGIVKVWSIVVEGWCKRSAITRLAMQRADELLLEMEDDQQVLVRPNILTYTSYVGGLSRCKDNDMARKAEEVLERMERHNVQPDMVAYTAVINCWAKASSRRERGMAATRALSILTEMERLYISKKIYIVKPSMITYATVISAIGNSLDPDAPQLAEGILQRMQKLHESGAIANLKPGTATYNAVIYALSQSVSATNRLRTAQRAEQLLDEMAQRAKLGENDVQPDVRTWASVLRAWTRSKQPDAAENAQRVLDKMEQRYKNGQSSIRPNFVCLTTAMGAWGHSKSADSLDKMERILLDMEESYEETLDPEIRPNTVSYVTCIDAFVRRNEPDAAQRSQATVDRMVQLYAKGLGHVVPTRTVFNVLIHAWSRSKEKGAALNAEKIFQWMESQSQSGNDLVRPDEVSLCAVLNAWANQAEHGGAERALQIWEHSESVSATDRGFRPTIAMPNIVIKAIARSKDPDAVRKAERILLRLEADFRSGKSHLRPNVTTFSSVINACAYCVGDASKRAEALDIALRTFYKLCAMEDEHANNITYGTVFKAVQNLMSASDEREELSRDLFDQCCDAGYVDYFVLSQVRYASPRLYRELVEGPCGLGGPGLKYGLDAVLKNIPTDWAANVVE